MCTRTSGRVAAHAAAAPPPMTPLLLLRTPFVPRHTPNGLRRLMSDLQKFGWIREEFNTFKVGMTSWDLNWHRSGSPSFKTSPGVTGNMKDIAYCFASILTSNLSGVASPRWPRSITENHISGCTSRDTVFVTSLITEALTPHFPRYLPVAGETLHGQEINVPMALQNRDPSFHPHADESSRQRIVQTGGPIVKHVTGRRRLKFIQI
ncbi:hypothetical protein B0H16DRAFT_1468588 [Mycena metata]|uniref:Uncharacterized protein n=1 Tax=Mycena metata TaxID=1033252 RepID=A0AAD7I0Q0_9AGAR|nr:hypothetical protein B0H16DRAFT_1468588 [Mycena metata]